MIDREARRKRAAQGVGLSQMEAMVEEEESPSTNNKGPTTNNDGDDRGNPFWFDK